MRTSCTSIVGDGGPARRRARADLPRRDRSYAELWTACRRFAAGLAGLGLERGERVGDLPRQADRDGRRDLRHLGRRRRVRAGQPAAEGRAGRLHPRRLHVRVLVTTPERLELAARGARASCGGRARRSCSAAPADAAPATRCTPGTRSCATAEARPRPGDRHRHGGDPLHLRAAPASPRAWCSRTATCGRRRERQPVPRERRRRRASSRRCRSASTPASAS